MASEHLQNSGHDGSVGEVAGELGLVRGDALDTNSAFSGDIFEDLVNQEEGVAMRKDLSDISIHENLRCAPGI